jgi:hypothetical protein
MLGVVRLQAVCVRTAFLNGYMDAMAMVTKLQLFTGTEYNSLFSVIRNVLSYILFVAFR